MKKLACLFALIVSGAVLAAPPKVKPPTLYRVGVAQPKGGGKVVRGASAVNTVTFQIARQTVDVMNDGSTMIGLVYINASTGAQVLTRQITIAPGCGQVTDSFGNVLAATTPPALCTAINSFASQLDTVIGNAAASGKLNL